MGKEDVLGRYYRGKFNSCGKGFKVNGILRLKDPNNIDIGINVTMNGIVHLETYSVYNNISTGYRPRIMIGDGVSMMSGCYISCIDSVEVGNGCLLGDNVFISDNAHGNCTLQESLTKPADRPLHTNGPVIIGSNVWLGRNVCVLGGVSIGDGAVIGANAVVTHDIPANCVAAGVPAKPVKLIE